VEVTEGQADMAEIEVRGVGAEAEEGVISSPVNPMKRPRRRISWT